MSVYVGLLLAMPTETTPAVEPRDDPGYARQRVVLRPTAVYGAGHDDGWHGTTYAYENASEVRFALASRPWGEIVGVGFFGPDRVLREAWPLPEPVLVLTGYQPWFAPGHLGVAFTAEGLALLDGADVLTDDADDAEVTP